ncbi:MAG: hypothetical protein ACFNYI_03410, partial [Eubacterium sp.]
KPGVVVSKTSGNAGIAYWINEHYGLSKDREVEKDDPKIHEIKAWVDEQYADGRTTALSTSELEKQVKKHWGEHPFQK